MAWSRADREYLRDGGVALGLFGLLVVATRTPFPPVRLPGYLFVYGFDAAQEALAPGLGGGAYQVALAGYVLGLAAVGGAIAGRLRRRYGPAGPLRYGLVGGVLAVGLYALVVLGALVVAVLPASWSPLVIAALVGLAGLWSGMRLAAWREPTE